MMRTPGATLDAFPYGNLHRTRWSRSRTTPGATTLDKAAMAAAQVGTVAKVLAAEEPGTVAEEPDIVAEEPAVGAAVIDTVVEASLLEAVVGPWDSLATGTVVVEGSSMVAEGSVLAGGSSSLVDEDFWLSDAAAVAPGTAVGVEAPGTAAEVEDGTAASALGSSANVLRPVAAATLLASAALPA